MTALLDLMERTKGHPWHEGRNIERRPFAVELAQVLAPLTQGKPAFIIEARCMSILEGSIGSALRLMRELFPGVLWSIGHQEDGPYCTLLIGGPSGGYTDGIRAECCLPDHYRPVSHAVLVAVIHALHMEKSQ